MEYRPHNYQNYGYVRVSSKDQNPERQIVAMESEGVDAIFIDKQSGKDFDRKEYKRMLKKVKKGDCIIIKSIDRLGRNYDDIKDEWKLITSKGVGIKVLDLPLLNTSTDKGDLTGRFIADLVLQLLAYVAETEREFIRQRQREGIKLAKARGVRFGALPKPIPDGFLMYANMNLRGEISSRKAAKKLGMSQTTFYRKAQSLRMKAQEQIGNPVEDERRQNERV